LIGLHLRRRQLELDPNKKTGETVMFDDDGVRRPTGHEVGMKLDTMSVEELNERIEMLKGEIARLEQAIATRNKVRSEADSLFKL
jgi:uncharacterized small protein (DUF1192 family)